MARSQYPGETMSAEAKKEIEIMTEIDRLFGEIERLGKEDPENFEAREELAGQIIKMLNEYRTTFGEGVDETVEEYHERLKQTLKESA